MFEMCMPFLFVILDAIGLWFSCGKRARRPDRKVKQAERKMRQAVADKQRMEEDEPSQSSDNEDVLDAAEENAKQFSHKKLYTKAFYECHGEDRIHKYFHNIQIRTVMQDYFSMLELGKISLKYIDFLLNVWSVCF